MGKSISKTTKSTVIPFKLTNQPIDYFKLEDSFFKPDFNAQRQITTLKAGDYFTLRKDAPKFDYNKKETVVFNFQVGQGKTTLCYELIEEYEKRGYCVIVCSPFIKLVNKDYEEIKSRIEKVRKIGFVKGKPIKVFKYDQVDDLNQWGLRMSEIASQTHSVHVMTINCLLGNSGNSEFEQAFSKKDYLQNLLDATKNKKVVLFIDEIHESINNFRPDLIPNLLKWKGRVEKVFIASATFTPATIPVIKACSLMTDKNVQIYETNRIKNNVSANINLHIVNIPFFNSNNFDTLIENEISFYQSKNRNINIITGSKAMAKKVSEIKNSFSTIITKQKNAKPYNATTVNLLTADNDITYHAGQNNIGTTFKTGVNINDKKSVLFIIFPYLTKNAPLNSYGIFSDGISSIIQALGRIRNGGDIHIFINDPETLFGLPIDYPLVFNSKEFVSHIPITNSYSDILTKYQLLINQLSNEITDMETNISSTNSSLSSYKKQFGFWYPNEQEFLLSNCQQLMLKNDNPSFGRLLAPYIIWSCLFNQFANGTLKRITFYGKSTVKIYPSTSKQILAKILQSHAQEIKTKGFRKSVEQIGKYLGIRYDANGNEEKIDYEIGNKKVKPGELISRYPTYLKHAVSILFNISTNSKFPDTKEEYINACINQANKMTTQSTLLIKTYKELSVIKTDFLKRINNSIVHLGKKNYILVGNEKIIDDSFLKQINSVVKDLKEYDLLLKNKAFSFMQDDKGTNEKRKVYAILSELFLDLNKNRKQIGNKQHYQINYIDPFNRISFTGLL